MSTRMVLWLTIMLLLVASSESETCDGRGFPGRPGIPGVPGTDGKDGAKGEKGDKGIVIALIFYVKKTQIESQKCAFCLPQLSSIKAKKLINKIKSLHFNPCAENLMLNPCAGVHGKKMTSLLQMACKSPIMLYYYYY